MNVHLTERGLIAFTTLICCTTLLLVGKDGTVGYTLLAVVMGYYGITFVPPSIKRIRGG